MVECFRGLEIWDDTSNYCWIRCWSLNKMCPFNIWTMLERWALNKSRTHSKQHPLDSFHQMFVCSAAASLFSANPIFLCCSVMDTPAAWWGGKNEVRSNSFHVVDGRPLQGQACGSVVSGLKESKCTVERQKKGFTSHVVWSPAAFSPMEECYTAAKLKAAAFASGGEQGPLIRSDKMKPVRAWWIVV